MRNLFCLLPMMASTTVFADPAVIEAVQVRSALDGTAGVSVTLRHPDSGWGHYADGWEVLSQKGARLGFRELLHPHVHEQPFTRALGGITIPEGTDHVLIRSRCSVDGWGRDLVVVPLGN